VKFRIVGETNGIRIRGIEGVAQDLRFERSEHLRRTAVEPGLEGRVLGPSMQLETAASAPDGLIFEIFEIGRTRRTGTREGRGGSRVYLESAVRRWA
jgi:hypothetical protein